MTFGAVENTRYYGRPVNLFLVKYGDGADSYFGYTDAERDITIAGKLYRSVAIQRGAIVVKGNMDRTTLQVNMALNLEVAELFRQYPPSSVVRLTIYQGHMSDPDGEFLVVWAGRVVSAKREDVELVLSCEPTRTSLKRLGLRRHYQYSCPHVLFGPHCKANKAAATVSRPIVSISGAILTFASGWSPVTPTQFLGGMIEWENAMGDTEYRTIIRATATQVTISGTLRDIATGDTVRLVRGCSHDMAGCASHNNILNFGGCPFIPKTNPVSTVNQFF